MKNVYLAYAPEDQERADELRRILLAQGHRPWIDSQPTNDGSWHEGIESAILNADALVLLLTAAAASSIDLTYAWSFALGRGLPVFVIVYADAEAHPRLQLAHRYDPREHGDENHFWDHFVADFNRLTQSESAKPEAAAPPIERAETAEAAEIDSSVMPEEPGYWLVMRRGPRPNHLFRLEREVVNLGRDLANDIVIRDSQVSRYHLRLSLRGHDYQLEDLGSSNGTRVNGAQVSGATELSDGDFIAIGESILLTYNLVYQD